MREDGRATENYLKTMEGSGAAITALLNARRQEKNVLIHGDKVLRQGDKTYLQQWRDEMAKINNWPGSDNRLKSMTTEYE
ncbi:MAG: hypothetical protein K8R53_06810, partial [Bacteroidales bacterium]|nr:hypothetical protein [Bacteroidales bacterium]